MRCNLCPLKYLRCILYFLVLFFILIFNTLGYCELADLEFIGQDRSHKPTLKDDREIVKEGITYTPVPSEKIPDVSDAHISESIKETIIGLKDAKYSLVEIVNFLKNNDRKAHEISIACLNLSQDSKYGFSGKEIHAALIKAGFSEKEADAAIPIAMRSDGQLFSTYPKAEGDDTDKDMLIRPNPFSVNSVKTIGQSEDKEQTLKRTDAQVNNNADMEKQQLSPNNIFNGLGNWQSFQNERYDLLRNTQANPI